MYVYDLVERRNVFVNRDVTEHLGYTTEELNALGENPLARLIHADDLPAVGRHHERLKSADDDARFELRYRMRDAAGWYREILSTDRVFARDDDGRVRQIVGTAQYIDELDLLRESNRRLAAANEELEQFAHIASHDLKSPLRGVDHLATWVLEDCESLLPASSVDHLRKMKDRIKRMERLLSDLLAYSRAGRRELSPERFTLDKILDNVTKLVPMPDGYCVHREGTDVEITTHRQPLEQIIRNLIDNSIKHRGDGGTRIDITASVPHGEDDLHLRLTDDGPGIPVEHRERVFGVFQTLDSPTGNQGSGIGLSVVRRILAARGGQIRIEHGPGIEDSGGDGSPRNRDGSGDPQGSGVTFDLRWPLRCRDDPAVGTSPPREAVP